MKISQFWDVEHLSMGHHEDDASLFVPTENPLVAESIAFLETTKSWSNNFCNSVCTEFVYYYIIYIYIYTYLSIYVYVCIIYILIYLFMHQLRPDKQNIYHHIYIYITILLGFQWCQYSIPFLGTCNTR